MKFPSEKSKNYEAEVNKYWNIKAKRLLLNRKIVNVEYLTGKECDEMMWYNAPITFQLDNGIWCFPSRDDEGNDGGALFTSDDNTSCLPVIDPFDG